MIVRYAVRAVMLIRGGSPDAVFPGHDPRAEGEETQLS